MRSAAMEAIRRAMVSAVSHRCRCRSFSGTNAAVGSSSSSDGRPDSLSFRIEELQMGEPVAFAFQSWMGDGFPVRRGQIFHTINRLRRFRMNRRGLEVMEWVVREQPYGLNDLDYSYLLEFTAKFHGIEQGEKLLCRIPHEFRTGPLYNNLVIACLEEGAVRLSLAYMKKMREAGHRISYLVFNRLILLHSSSCSRRSGVSRILTQMKADGVTRHVSTFNILMKIKADDHDLEGLDKTLHEMKEAGIEPNEISYCILATAHATARLHTACEAYVELIERSYTGDNWSTLEILVGLYGYLGRRGDVERTWEALKKLPSMRSRSYMVSIESFGRLGELRRAEELFSEMSSKGWLKKTQQFNSLIAVYCRHGLAGRASKVYREMKTEGCCPNGITYRHLALGFLRCGRKEEALKAVVVGGRLKASWTVRKSRPWLETTTDIVEELAEKGDVENAEKLFEELEKAKYSRHAFVYNILMKAYVKMKAPSSSCNPRDLLRRMILAGWSSSQANGT